MSTAQQQTQPTTEQRVSAELDKQLRQKDVVTEMNLVLLAPAPGLLIGAVAYYNEQQTIIQAGGYLLAPSLANIVRDYLLNIEEQLQSEAKAEAAHLDDEAELFAYARECEQ